MSYSHKTKTEVNVNFRPEISGVSLRLKDYIQQYIP